MNHNNFTAEDLQRLNSIKDLEALKCRAMELISNQDSTRPMKPEKVEWFRNHIKGKHSKASVIKMMWDLLLAGEGSAVVGSGHSMSKNNYRARFK